MTDKVSRAVAAFFLGFPVWAIRGWIVAWYWNWFMAESFALPLFTIAHGMAVSTIVSAAMISTRAYQEKQEHSTLYYMAMNVVGFLLAWPFGWAMHALWVWINVPVLLSWVPS